nr:FRG domain-containing protein [uncultured Faecalimonas sp.]
MKQLTAYTLEELEQIIHEEMENGKIWFRGHSNHKYVLLPNLYRTLYATRDQFNIPIVPKKITEYNNSGDIVPIPDQLYINSFYSRLNEKNIEYPEDYIEQICFAQHYGVKTRLLDWTTDINVAYFFSHEGRKKDTKTAIYMLNPEKFNQYMSHMNQELYNYKFKDYKFPDSEMEKKIVQSSMIKVDGILEPSELNANSKLTPFAIRGPQIDRRICRQSGNFIAFGTLIWSIEYYEDEKLKNELNFDFETDLKCITKIILSSKLSNEIGGILRKKGIDKSYIYYGHSDIDDISKQAEKSNEEVISKSLKEWEKEYFELKNNSPAIFVARELMANMLHEKNV